MSLKLPRKCLNSPLGLLEIFTFVEKKCYFNRLLINIILLLGPTLNTFGLKVPLDCYIFFFILLYWRVARRGRRFVRQV